MFEMNIYMPVFIKLIVPFLIIFRLILSIGFWDKGIVSFKLNVLTYINSRIWFMSRFICYPSLRGFKELSNIRLKAVDMGWFEILGGQGVFNLNKFFFFVFEHWLILAINCYLILFVCFVICV